MPKYRDKEFSSREDLFDFLRENKHDLMEFKKATIKQCDSLGTSIFSNTETKDGEASKLISDTNRDSDGIIHRTIVGNTYYFLDSHGDVHIKGCFTNSIKERGVKRIAHLHDHIYKLEAKVGKFEDVYEKKIKWRDLGIDNDGTTWALLADSAIKSSLNEQIFVQYKDGEIDQHSVGMWYVKLELAIDDEEDEVHYKVWETYIDLILNKEQAIKQGYFWVVKEAKLIEISAVIAGSNPVTPTLPVKDTEDKSEASAVEEKINTDPPAGSQDVKKHIIWELI